MVPSDTRLSRRSVLRMSLATAGAILLPRWVFAEAAADAQPFTLVAMPDTQNYADVRLKQAAKQWEHGDLREIFYGQTQWIRDNAKTHNIVFVCHEGDIVQTDYDKEWEIADQAMRTLDGVVPYSLCLGNHDMGFNPKTGKCATNRQTLFNTYFPVERFENRPWYGGHFGKVNDNHWCRFTAAGVPFLVLALEFLPRDEVLTWASDVVAKHPSHRVIVVTHWYLNSKGQRNGRKPNLPRSNNAQAMWQKLIAKHRNIFLVLSGHISSEARATAPGAAGNQVHQVLANYQTWQDGGDGYLRLMTFRPADSRIEVRTFTTRHTKYRDTPTSRFDLPYSPAELAQRGLNRRPVPAVA